VLDLEALASHRGSAFGGIGLPPQPSHAQFQEAVRAGLEDADPDRVLWVEDEGPFIGSVGVPLELQRAIAAAPVIELGAPFPVRVDRLTATYGAADPDVLVAALERSRRRLGTPSAERATWLVRRGDVRGAVALVLSYYDAAYRHRTSAHRRRVLGAAALDDGAEVAAYQLRSAYSGSLYTRLARLGASFRLHLGGIRDRPRPFGATRRVFERRRA
jgi:tRNA 2-selenouridine synthase